MKRATKKTIAAKKVDKKKKATKKDVDDLLGEKTSGQTATVLQFGAGGMFVSVTQFCRETGKDRDTVSSKLRTVKISAVKGPRGQPLYRLRELFELVFLRDADGDIDIDKMDPFRRKAHYAAELDKMKVQTENGELVPRIEVEQEQARIAKITAQFFDTLPDVLERDCGATQDQLGVIERKLDEVRENIYKEMVGGTDEETTVRASA